MGKSDNSDLKSSLHEPTEKRDLKSMSSTDVKKTKSNAKISETAVNRASVAYQKVQEKSPYNQSLENLYLKKGKRVLKAHKRTATHPPAKHVGVESNNARGSWDDNTKIDNPVKQKTTHSRSHSQPGSRPPGKMKYDDPLFDKVRHAKKVAENAIKVSYSHLYYYLWCQVYFLNQIAVQVTCFDQGWRRVVAKLRSTMEPL